MRKSLTIMTMMAFFFGLICSIWLSAGAPAKQAVAASDLRSHHQMSMKDAGDQHDSESHCAEQCEFEVNLTSKSEQKKLTPVRQVLVLSWYAYLTALHQQSEQPDRTRWRTDTIAHSASQPVFAATNRFRI